MIVRGALGKESDIFHLLEVSYPNMHQRLLETTFQKRFDPQHCLYIAEDGKIISTLQVRTAQFRFRGYLLEVSVFDQIATLPDYRRRHKMRTLLQAAMDEAAHNQLFSFVYAMNPRLFERYGFKTVHISKRYLLAAQECRKSSYQHVRTFGSAKQMAELYQQFTSHFDGYYQRDIKYYESLLDRCHNSEEKLCFYYEQGQMKGYCLYLLNNKEAYVQEIVYLDSRALKQMLSYLAQNVNDIQLIVSNKEKIERVYPLAIPRRETYLMARLNNIALFNKLYNCSVRHAEDAFELLQKPMWNHHM